MILHLTDTVFKELIKTAESHQVETYVVGGYVRDLLLKRDSKDVDIVVIGDGIAFAQAFANSLPYKTEFAVFKNYGTAMVKLPGWEIEFVGARKESYVSESRKPSVSPGSLKDDQLRRDFTINALAISLNKKNLFELVDPFEGLIDLENGIIKTPLAPEITFEDDPLRMLRAIRFSSQLGFVIENSTLEAIKVKASRMSILSRERISEEFNKILLSPKPSIGLKQLFDTGLLAHFFPQLQAMAGIDVKNGKAHKDNFIHTIRVVDNVALETNNLWLRWATLLHDIGKPPTKRFTDEQGTWTFHGHEDKGSRMVSKIFRDLKLPLNEKMRYVEKLVAMHHRPKVLAEEGVTDSAIRRLIVDAGEDLDDLFTLCRADMTSRFPEKIERFRANLNKVQELVKEVEERDALRNWQPPISGEEIMAFFNLQPNKTVGLIKSEIREAILEGKIPNTKEAATALMRELGHKFGLS